MGTVPSISFSHAGIFVMDLALMESFYTRVLGLTVTDRGRLGERDLVFTSADPTEHHQLVLATGRPADLSFNMVNQISFRADSLATLLALYQRIQNEAVSEIDPASHGNALSVYFRDPEGNRVEVFIDTPWYVDQPMKIPMDLRRTEAEIWRWAEETASKLPGFRPRDQWEDEMRRRMGRA